MTVKKLYPILFLLTISFGVLTSCKSHKKQTPVDTAYVGETVGVKKKKKNEKTHKTIGEKIADESLTWLGTPYGYGHSEKGVATDCSGLVLTVYLDVAGVKLPRNSAQQADFCDNLKEHDVKAGDLVFFATGKDIKKVSHVGVMINKEEFIHASTSKGVILSEMTTPYYKRTFIKFGRVPGI